MEESTPRTRASRRDEHRNESATEAGPPREEARERAESDPETGSGAAAADDPGGRGGAASATGAGAGAQSGADGAAQGAELEELRRELEELNDRHLRLAAEFNNYRRRQEQERLESWARAQGEMLSLLLDVFDDLDRVAELDLSNATVEAIMEGVDLVQRKIVRSLREADVEVIDPRDAPFDPMRMEAMMRVPAPSADADDRVAQVMQKGYAIKGVLVRPARVAVYKAD